jgi:tetratricopeptide (TPR) repeat protein
MAAHPSNPIDDEPARSRRRGEAWQNAAPRMDAAKQKRLLLVLSAVLVAAIVVVYAQLRSHDAIHFDDNVLVTQNAAVQSGISWRGIQWALATPILGIWHPLTTLSHMLDCELFGMDMGMHHVTSLVLHIANTVLLLWLLHQITGAIWRPGLVAALFALHPLNVESVAWIAERKNVLSTLFWLLTTASYVEWVKRPSGFRYGLTLVLFALGLMAKPMLVTLPCTLLLLDYWPLGRWRGTKSDGVTQLSFGQLALEKLPFFAVTALASYLTYALQQDVVAAAVRSIPIHLRAAGAALSYVAYLRDAFWPSNLAMLYPIEGWLDGRQLLVSAAVLGGVTAVALIARTRAPYLLVGWLFYLGTLVPVIGIVHVGSQTRADRYVYVPLIGVFVMIAWSLGACVERRQHIRTAVVGAALVTIAVLGAVTMRQAARWKDSITLFEHTLSVTENNLVVHNALGVALGDAGRHEEAIKEFTEALRLRPDSIPMLESLGIAYASAGRMEDAAKTLREVIAREPTSYQTHASLGLVLAQLGQNDEAIEHFRLAVQMNPESAEAHAGLGALLVSLGRNEEALPHLRIALERNPNFAQTHTNLGLVLVSRGSFDGAIESFQASLAIDPAQPRVLGYLGSAYMGQGKVDDAIARFTEALRLDPSDVEAEMRLADALANRGQFETAIAHYEQALARRPENVALHYNLGVMLARQGRAAEALRQYEECVRLEPNHALALYQLGRAAAAAGEIRRAIELYRAALKTSPGDTETLMSLAWIFATHDDAAVRSGPEAVLLATRASERLGGQHIGALATLAAALAEDGQFEEAAKTVDRALNLARMSGQRDHVATLEESLRKYKAGERMYPAK